MGSAAQLEALTTSLQSRRAGIEARRQVDQERLVATLRGVAAQLITIPDPEQVAAVAELLGDPELCDVLDDLERTAESDRTRLRAVAVHEYLREPARRMEALERRLVDAQSRIDRHRADLERLDTDAFRWLNDRRLLRSRKPGLGDRLWRAVTLAGIREQRAEDALREHIGAEGFESAKQAYGRAEKGLRRAEVEAERLAHTRALIEDLVQERDDLTQGIVEEPARRLRSLRAAVASSLLATELGSLVRKAPVDTRAALAEAHALEARLRGWEDLESALDAGLDDLAWAERHLYSSRDMPEAQNRLERHESLPPAIDRLVAVLAAFHNFAAWQQALEAGNPPSCWALMAGDDADCLAEGVLAHLVPRLFTRSD